jgi:hypothetical protein
VRRDGAGLAVAVLVRRGERLVELLGRTQLRAPVAMAFLHERQHAAMSMSRRSWLQPLHLRVAA